MVYDLPRDCFKISFQKPKHMNKKRISVGKGNSFLIRMPKTAYAD